MFTYLLFGVEAIKVCKIIVVIFLSLWIVNLGPLPLSLHSFPPSLSQRMPCD
jgi:hypothetical protein